MSEYIDNCKRITEILRQREWLFKQVPPIDISNYIKHFEDIINEGFFLYPTMMPYKCTLLDKYKDNVFNTMFLPAAGGNLSLHTILQLNKEYHIFLLWANSTNNMETVVYATLYTTIPSDYRKFLIENEEYIYDEALAPGFAGMVGFGNK